MKKYVLIAGVNGAGKSTLYQTMDSLKEMKRINTDEIVRTFGSWKKPADVMEAGKIAVNRVKEYFIEGVSFNQETTLCGNAIIRNMKQAKKLGYEIELHYVGVDTVEIAKQRIAYRVEHGGHGISDVDVERRYYKSFSQLKKVLEICNLVIMYDNSKVFKRFAIYRNGMLVSIENEIPYWYEKYVKNNSERL